MGDNSTVRFSGYEFRRERRSVCFATKSAREFVCIAFAQRSFPRARIRSGVSLDSLLRAGRPGKDDCLYAGRADRHRLSRLVFSNFRVVETPCDSSQTRAVPPLRLRLGASDHMPLGSRPAECFPSSGKSFIDSSEKYFRNG